MMSVEHLRVSQEGTMEDPLWRGILGRSLGQYDSAGLVSGMCHDDSYRQETTRLHALFCRKAGWSSLNHNRVLHQALVQSLRELEIQFVVEDIWPFQERASGSNVRLDPLRMNTTTEFRNGGIIRQPPPTQEYGACSRHYYHSSLRQLQSEECSTS